MSRHKKTTEQFIKEAKAIHGDKYDYSKVKYKGTHTKVCIICPNHGDFFQKPSGHLMGLGCNLCSNPVHDSKSFIEESKKIHGNKYDYSKVKYISSQTKLCIICPIHGEFWQLPYNHIKGSGCPKCKSSHLEREIRTFLEENNVEYEEQKTFEWLKFKKQQYLDFYLPQYKAAIECQGEHHFQKSGWGKGDNGKKVIERDLNKENLCKEHGIMVVYYSKLGIEYPYKVCEDKVELLNEIKNVGQINAQQIDEVYLQ